MNVTNALEEILPSIGDQIIQKIKTNTHIYIVVRFSQTYE